MHSRLGGWKWLGSRAAFAVVCAVAVLTAVGAGFAGPGAAQAPSTPAMIAVAFGPSEVWTPSQNAILALHDCHSMDFSCVQPIMQADGASADAIAFYRLTEWFLGDIQNTGLVQVATVFNPWRANENNQPALLGGIPAVILPEQEAQLLNLEGSVERDPAYGAIQAAHPNVMFWGSSPSLEATDTAPDGGPRFIFDYRLLDGCHACAILGNARVAFDFAADGTFAGAHLLDVVAAGS